MKVTFLYHSCFLVELETCRLLFDWYRQPFPNKKSEKPLYVFSSHAHGDHYSSDVFRIGTDAKYILSDDISVPRSISDTTSKRKYSILTVSPSKTYQLDQLTIQTYASTDEGVAYLIKADGMCIYHAGDLNWWHWEGEPSEWNEKMKNDFHHALSEIRGEEVDLAFLPLDPRQGLAAYHLGFDAFMRTVGARHAFPMHFWKQWDLCSKFRKLECAKDYADRVYEIHGGGEEFTIL